MVEKYYRAVFNREAYKIWNHIRKRYYIRHNLESTVKVSDSEIFIDYNKVMNENGEN